MALNIPSPRGAELKFSSIAKEVRNLPYKMIYPDLCSAGNVNDSRNGLIMLIGSNERFYSIPYVRIVTHLITVTVDYGLLSRENAFYRNRDHTCIRAIVLTRTVIVKRPYYPSI